MYAKHLQVGVNKGAITQEQADAKFEAWKAEKEVKIQTKSSTLQQSKAKSKAARLEAEAKVSNTRADNIAAKNKVADEAIVASVVEAINAADEEATGVEVVIRIDLSGWLDPEMVNLLDDNSVGIAAPRQHVAQAPVNPDVITG
jgi:hypothetical protein